jgi:hypothetical protein
MVNIELRIDYLYVSEVREALSRVENLRVAVPSNYELFSYG